MNPNIPNTKELIEDYSSEETSRLIVLDIMRKVCIYAIGTIVSGIAVYKYLTKLELASGPAAKGLIGTALSIHLIIEFCKPRNIIS